MSKYPVVMTQIKETEAVKKDRLVRYKVNRFGQNKSPNLVLERYAPTSLGNKQLKDNFGGVY